MKLNVTVPGDAEEVICRFLHDLLVESGSNGYLVGISGGLDSAVVAALAVRAVGKDRVKGLLLPPTSTTDECADLACIIDGQMICRHLGIEHDIVPVEPIATMIGTMLDVPDDDRAAMGNIIARARMVVLFATANREGLLVVGTSNKSELLTGYFTKFGDGASDLIPIGDLYKTQVRELAESLGIPDEILEKAPTADLWEGQTDEGDLGLPYAILDRILLGFELRLDHTEVAKEVDVGPEVVERIWSLHKCTAHKRNPPVAPKLGIRTVGLDWRE